MEFSLLTSNKEEGEDPVRKEIESREIFSYKYSRFWLLWRPCCFCCFRNSRKREDFLFRSAAGKLNEETDLLEIVKKLRVH